MFEGSRRESGHELINTSGAVALRDKEGEKEEREEVVMEEEAPEDI